VRTEAQAISVNDFIGPGALRELVARAVDEDLGRGDITSDLLIPATVQARGVLRSRSAGVVAGLEVSAMVFEIVDPTLRFAALAKDGAKLVPGQDIAVVSGSARSLLRGERVALNFIQRMSGIATLTSRFVEAVAGTSARIVDTRKTTPGLRALEKYAVRAGGGFNHRRDLSDAMLIKDNHISSIKASGLSLAEAVGRARTSLPHTMKIEIEIDGLAQIEEALVAGVDIILLDNLAPEELRKGVELIDRRAITECSGGVSLDTVAEIAATGVDIISVGALTHSAGSLDIGLDFEA
jgi:nicotinate-nucleotide pyrophosphorylase (carboxylating)